MSYIIRNEFGAFCSVCGEHLSQEEDDWDECGCCGGQEDPEEEPEEAPT